MRSEDHELYDVSDCDLRQRLGFFLFVFLQVLSLVPWGSGTDRSKVLRRVTPQTEIIGTVVRLPSLPLFLTLRFGADVLLGPQHAEVHRISSVGSCGS